MLFDYFDAKKESKREKIPFQRKNNIRGKEGNKIINCGPYGQTQNKN